MPTYKSVLDADIADKKVLLRAGFDVPIEDGKVTDESRIVASIPTIRHIIDNGGSVIIMAHQDRPKGKIVPEFSQKPLVPILEKLLRVPVQFADSCVGSDTKLMTDAMKPGDVLLLENLRYDKREEENDASFAQELASYADFYVNDAFTNCHRKHASMVSVAEILPAYMGLQLKEEVDHLSLIVEHPQHPLTLIVCGAKIETKVPVIEHFLKKGDDILVGGAIANTFAKASGLPIGKSLYEEEYIAKAKELMSESEREHTAVIHLPSDAVVAMEPESVSVSIDIKDIAQMQAIYDIGPKSVERYVAQIRASKMIVWNGPLGMYEIEQFAGASKQIAKAMTEATARGAITIIGGGDTIDFHTRYGLPMTGYTFVSTGGGAMLEFVSGKKLPALEVLAQ